jgi:hypothetical protein
MKIKFLLIFLFWGIIIYTVPCSSSINLSPGIKIGINYNKLGSLQGGIGLPGDGFPKYYYPAGFVVGLFCENRLTNNLSLINELSYINIPSKLTVYTTWEEIVEQEFHGQYIRFPCLLKYQMNCFCNPYFSSGINLGYLKKARYESYGKVYDITQKLHSIDISAEIGSGVQSKLQNIYILTEVRCLVELRQNQYSKIGKWRNCSIQFLFGMQYK